MPNHFPLCPDCFHDKGYAQVCPHCGWDESAAPFESVLQPGVALHHGQYLIGRVLGKPGGFGITYLGFDTSLEIRVAIKEYFPQLCLRKHDHTTVSAPTVDADEFRAALEGFIKEVRIVAKLKHDNIVRVNNFFEENGTGYLVMDYYEGLTLAEYLQSQGGRLPESTALGILMPILDGLKLAHQAGIVHRDIKPQNIYLTIGKQPILLDFGAARPIVRRDASLQATIGLHTPGYSPFEQQMTNGKQGPWTDVYAGAATLYHMVTGTCPPPAGDRILDGDPLVPPTKYGVSAKLSEILVKALAVKPEGRYQSIREFQSAILALSGTPPDSLKSPTEKPLKAPAHQPISLSPAVRPPITSASNGGLLIWIWGLVGLAIAVLALFLFESGIMVYVPFPTSRTPVALAVEAAPTTPTAPANDNMAHGWLGVTTQDIAPGSAESVSLPENGSVLIVGVAPGGPADRAGIKPGDILVEVNGKQIITSSTLKTQISPLQPGTVATLAIIRDQTDVLIQVTIGMRPDVAPEGVTISLSPEEAARLKEGSANIPAR